MTIQILAVGKLAKGYLKDGVDDYRNRILRHCKFEIVEIPEQDGRCNEPRQKEAELLLEKLERQQGKPNSYCIALSPGCSGGLGAPNKSTKLYSSEQLAAQIAALQAQGRSAFSFVIGGSDGLDPSLLEYADMLLSFSPLTFPHQLFRLLLCEQIYRCLKINSGQTYHK